MSIDWIFPGLNIKRWLVLITFGILLTFLGGAGFSLFLVSTDQGKEYAKVLFLIFTFTGIPVIIYGVSGIVRALLKVLSGQQAHTQVINKAMHRFSLSEGPHIVAFGGGTGMGNLLRGLKEHTSNITAIVTVADNGGHSGQLRKDLGMHPPGDIRQCLIALADSGEELGELMNYRFDSNDMQGFNFGNLFLAAMNQITGDFTTAVEQTSLILNIRGKVIPACSKQVSLIAKYADGSQSTGEVEIGSRNKDIVDLQLKPNPGPIATDIKKALKQAEMIILSSGSLYTSILPNLIVDGMLDAIRESPAEVVYLCNTMTEPGETLRMSAADHIKALYKITGQEGWIDTILVNDKIIAPETLSSYAKNSSYPVKVDLQELKELNVTVLSGAFVEGEGKAHHNPRAVASALMQRME
jgi:uncharacterized cofD-like protein